MSDPLTPELLGRELSRLLVHANALLDLLTREREALVARDIDALKEVTDQKEIACRTLASAQAQFATRSISDHVAEISSEQRPNLDMQYQQLIALVESCRHLNQVNGKIAHRSQQSNLALLKVLTGEVNPLYEQHGRSQPNRSRMSSPVVKA